jgi:parallel beta-helix repeat protein
MKKINVLIIVMSLLLTTCIVSVNASFLETNDPYIDPETHDIPYDIYVDDDYDGATPGWQITHFDNISAGINAVNPGGAIYVYGGIYDEYEKITINKPLTLKGENQDSIIYDTYTEIKNTNNVIISDFSIKDSSGYGVAIKQSSNCNINNNYFFHCSSGGIAVVGSHGNNFSYNTITSYPDQCCVNWNGFMLYEGSSYNHIYKNDISNTYMTGICLFEVYNNIISNNIIKDIYGGTLWHYQDFGIKFDDADNNIISDNYIKNEKGWAVALDIYKGPVFNPFASHSDNNTFSGNIFTKCDKAIEMGKCNNNTFIGNNITSNNYGYRGGLFYKTLTEWGIYLAKDNTFYHNNFINNNINAIDNSTRNKWYSPTLKEGNYWDDFKEKYPFAKPKTLRPWIWNTPYGIPPFTILNKDLYPLVDSYSGESSYQSQPQSLSSPPRSPTNI